MTDAQPHTEYELGPEGWTFTMHLPRGVADEVMAHELAHIVQRVRYGPDEPVHSIRFASIAFALLGCMTGSMEEGGEA